VHVGVEQRQFLGFLVDVGRHHIPQRHDSRQPSVLQRQHMPHMRLLHSSQAHLVTFVDVGDHELGRHHLADQRRGGISSRRDDPRQHVALGEDADQTVVVEHGKGADVVGGHQPRGVDGGSGVGDDNRLAFPEDRFDRSHVRLRPAFALGSRRAPARQAAILQPR
jgi:hypothetical protein